MSATLEKIQQQCAHYGGVPARCLLDERSWAHGVIPTKCRLCPNGKEDELSRLRSELAAAQAERDAWKMQADERLEGLIETHGEIERLTKERDDLRKGLEASTDLCNLHMNNVVDFRRRAQSAEAALEKMREAARNLGSQSITGGEWHKARDALRALIEKEGEP